MLDDLKSIHLRDKFDVLGAAERQASQLAETTVFSPRMPLLGIHNIVCVVEHAAASEAQIIKLITRCIVPFEIVDYDIPAYVGKTTLCIVVSSRVGGSSLLAMAAKAASAGATVVIIATDERIITESDVTQFQVMVTPINVRTTIRHLSVCKAIGQVLEAYDLGHGIAQEFSNQSAWLTGLVSTYKPEVPVKSNFAKQVALELIGKTVVIYAGPLLGPVANNWKTAINTYAKQLAWVGNFGGGLCSDIEGWTKQPVRKPYAIVELLSQWERSDISRRREVTDRLLSGLRPSPVAIELQGTTLVQDVVHACVLGDMVAAYLAIAGGISPGTTEMMTKLMREVA